MLEIFLETGLAVKNRQFLLLEQYCWRMRPCVQMCVYIDCWVVGQDKRHSKARRNWTINCISNLYKQSFKKCLPHYCRSSCLHSRLFVLHKQPWILDVGRGHANAHKVVSHPNKFWKCILNKNSLNMYIWITVRLLDVGRRGHDNAHDHPKQPQRTAEDLNNKNLDEERAVLRISQRAPRARDSDADAAEQVTAHTHTHKNMREKTAGQLWSVVCQYTDESTRSSEGFVFRVYIHTCIYIPTFIHMYIYLHVYVYAHVHTWWIIHMYEYVMYVYVYIHIQMCLCTRTQTLHKKKTCAYTAR